MADTDRTKSMNATTQCTMAPHLQSNRVITMPYRERSPRFRNIIVAAALALSSQFAFDTRGANPPVLACAPDKTVECGTDWNFDSPTVTSSCVFDSLVYDDSVNDLVTRFDPGTNEVGDEIIL